MNYKDDEFLQDRDDRAETDMNNNQPVEKADAPTAHRVDDQEEVTEEDLKRNFLFGDAEMKPVREGQPMGGEAFGENNITPSGDDENNPSQNAGYNNAYFARTEPAQEHPENSNFTANSDNEYIEGTVDSDGQNQQKEEGPIDLSDREKFGIDVDDERR